MSKINRFEDIIAWQRAIELSVKLYGLFKEHKDFAFKNQIQRAAISIANNIAEGFERKSNNEFQYFLFAAKGSSGEVRSMLHLAILLDVITEEVGNELITETEEISKILSRHIKLYTLD